MFEFHEVLYLQAALPRYVRSYNLHSGLRPSLVFNTGCIQYRCIQYRLQLTDSNGQGLIQI